MLEILMRLVFVAAVLEVKKTSVVMEACLSDNEGYPYSIGQMELLEIINKVKAEELSIDNAELLFKGWKLRYNNRRSRFKQQRQVLTVVFQRFML